MDEEAIDGCLDKKLALYNNFILWMISCEDNHSLMIVISFLPIYPLKMVVT